MLTKDATGVSTRELQHRRRQRLARLRGRFWCEVYERTPEGGARLAERSKVRHNDVVVTHEQLLLGLLANEATFSGGVLRHAFGSGDPLWDVGGPPAVNPLTDTLLVAETGRIVPDSIIYLTGLGGTPLPSPVGAKAIKVTTTIPFISTFNGTNIREQGLFGGNATAALNSGFMIDNFRHEKRAKTVSKEFKFFVELFF